MLDDPDADAGFVNSGYLILAEEGDTATQLAANLALQREHGAMTEQVSADQVLELHPLLDVSDVAAIGYEPESGYADPHMTTHSLARAAKRRGAEIRTGTSVAEIIEERGEVRGVRTSAGPIYAPSVISALGPWTQALTGPLGIEIPLATYRHTVLTLEGAEPYRNDLPIVKDLTVENKMYFRSEAETLLVGTGDSGVSISDPDDTGPRAHCPPVEAGCAPRTELPRSANRQCVVRTVRCDPGLESGDRPGSGNQRASAGVRLLRSRLQAGAGGWQDARATGARAPAGRRHQSIFPVALHRGSAADGRVRGRLDFVTRRWEARSDEIRR